MMWLRKSKKGFTLIELMVVVAIIGVLALLGLRLYTGQQLKAKNAIVKANVGTIQTLIQAELADHTLSEVWNYIQLSNDIYGDGIFLFKRSGIHNPLGGAQETNTAASISARAAETLVNAGTVYVYLNDATLAEATYFNINGVTADGKSNELFPVDLTSRR